MPRPSRRWPCRVDGCDGQAGGSGTGRGLCAKHYSRWRRTGGTENQRRPWTPAEDKALRDLPVSPISGFVVRGARADLALKLERSPRAVSMRRLELMRSGLLHKSAI